MHAGSTSQLAPTAPPNNTNIHVLMHISMGWTYLVLSCLLKYLKYSLSIDVLPGCLLPTAFIFMQGEGGLVDEQLGQIWYGCK